MTPQRTAYGVIAIVAAALVAVLCYVYVFPPAAPSPSAPARAQSDLPTAQPVVPLVAARTPVARQVRLLVRDPDQNPLPGVRICLADSPVDQELGTTDPDGIATVEGEVGHGLALERAGYRSEAVLLDERSEQVVVMHPEHRLVFRVRSDQGTPIEGATIHLGRRWLDPNELEGARPDGITDAAGELEAVKPPGRYFLHASHRDFIHARWDNADAVLMVPPTETVDVVMATPHVIAFEIEGGNLLSHNFQCWGSLTVARNAPASQRIREMVAQITAQFPGATASVWLPRGPASASDRCEVRLWMLGRSRIDKVLTPVPWDRFVAPVAIDATEAPASDDFGTVMLHFVNGDGTAMSPLRLQMQQTPEPGTMPRPRPFLMRVVPGELLTVPAGSYRLLADGEQFLDQVLAEPVPIRVERGAFVEQRIVLPEEHVWCTLRVTRDGQPVPGSYGLGLRHVASQRKSMHLSNNPDRLVHIWIPSGLVECRVATGPDEVYQPVYIDVQPNNTDDRTFTAVIDVK
jgi:hypothetical protein